MSPVSEVSKPGMSRFVTVPNVQELSRKQLETVPEEYVRSEEDRPTVKSPTPDSSIPIIDLKNLLDNNHSEEEMLKLHMACEEWGFFQLINHGVPHPLIKGMKGLSHEFFKLPLEEKQKYALQPNGVEGYGQQFAVGGHKLDWGDMLFIRAMPVSQRDMSYWPTKPENFREMTDAYSLEIRKVATRLLTLIAQNLNLKPDYFNDKFGEDAKLSLRLNYYPPCPQPELVLGLHPHSDSGGITLLVQDCNTEGLNIRKEDSWISVKPIPNAFIVNVGDLVEIMSNGKYRSVMHRVITNREKERLSIAAFYSPSYSAEIGPAQELVDQSQHPPLYKTISHAQFLRHLLVDKLREKRVLDFVKLDSART